jgi:predicted O-methyltransferase YrrM
MDKEYIEKQWLQLSNKMGDGIDRITGWGEVNSDQRASFSDVLEITKPKSMMEIGFNRGASALTWLLNGVDFLYSVDVDGSMNSVNFLKAQFNSKERIRFNFKRINSQLLTKETLGMDFDLIFIDGDHSFNGCGNDIEKSLLFNPKFLLFDDYFHPGHQADIQAAIRHFPNLKMIKEYFESPGLGLYEVL